MSTGCLRSIKTDGKKNQLWLENKNLHCITSEPTLQGFDWEVEKFEMPEDCLITRQLEAVYVSSSWS